MRKTIGHYEIVAELGRGGMGIVYKGFEPALNRHVAIKTLADHLAADPGVVERFMREARSMAQLSDAHIVQVYMVGEDHGQPFFAMEFVEGESLADRLKREGRIDSVEARRIVMQSAQGLAVAHEHGVIHRDIKPGNLLLTKRGVVKVADFGISLAASDMGNKLTGTGQFVGTPGYLSPEICLGKPSDRRSDIFSLGIVLFEMLTGRMPFVDESPLGLMLSVVQSSLPDVRELASDVDEYTVEILSGMVAKDIEARYQSCEALVEALLAAGTPYHASHTFNTPNPSAQPAVPAASVAPRAPTPATLPVQPAGASSKPPPAATTPLPQPTLAATPSPAAAAAAPAAMPPAAATEVMPAAAPAPVKRSSSLMPLAVAALLLVGIASAGGYLWVNRDQGLAPDRVVASVDSTAAPAAATAPTADAAVDAAPGVSEPVASPAAADTGALAVADVADTQTSSAAVGAETPAEPATPTEHPLGIDVAGIEKAADSLEQSLTSVGEDLSQLAEAAPSETRRTRLGEKIAAAREGQAALRTSMASAAPERPAEPVSKPLPPRVLVVTRGDPAVTGPAQMAIEEALEEAGVTIADLDLVPGLDRYGEDSTLQLLAAVKRSGAASAVVMVTVIPMGQQELTYYGESSTLYTAQIRVRAYSVERRESIGRLNQAQLNFTSLNADINTRQALEPILRRMVAGVRRQLASR